MKDLASFEAALANDQAPPGLSRPLLALWQLGRSDWDAAHATVQEDESDPACAWVHALLHRIEGDRANAAYWYRRAGRPVGAGDHRSEWRAIAAELLRSGGRADLP